MKVVELYGRVRYAVQIEGLSRREAARQFGIDPRTVAKMLAFKNTPDNSGNRPRLVARRFSQTFEAPSDPSVHGIIKWFNPEKGFGFVELSDGSGDAFLRGSVLAQRGINAIEPGEPLEVRIAPGHKGPHVTEIVSVAVKETGTVKWFNVEKGYGFIARDSGGKDVFVHVSALKRSGLTSLGEGQHVVVDVVEGRKGLEATEVHLRRSPRALREQGERDNLRRYDPDAFDHAKMKRLRALREQKESLHTMTLGWEIFPPGTVDEVVRLFSKGIKGNGGQDERILRERVEAFAALEPESYIRGVGGFDRYIGAKFSEELVVFENMRYGNALYILYEKWDEISKRSRIDLLRETGAHFDRIIHAPGWREQLDETIRRERHRRK